MSTNQIQKTSIGKSTPCKKCDTNTTEKQLRILMWSCKEKETPDMDIKIIPIIQ